MRENGSVDSANHSLQNITVRHDIRNMKGKDGVQSQHLKVPDRFRQNLINNDDLGQCNILYLTH